MVLRPIASSAMPLIGKVLVTAPAVITSDNPSKEAAQEATIIRGGSQLLANYIKIDCVSKPYSEVLLLAQKYLQLDLYLRVSG